MSINKERFNLLYESFLSGKKPETTILNQQVIEGVEALNETLEDYLIKRLEKARHGWLGIKISQKQRDRNKRIETLVDKRINQIISRRKK